MKKTIKIILLIVAAGLLLYVLKYFKDSNAKEVVDFKVAEPYYTSIKTKIAATGTLNPEEEIELKPQISGIVDKILVEEGDVVKKGELIAKIRVVPKEQSLVSAKNRIASSQLSFNNAKTLYNRNKVLFEKGVISQQDFEASELSFNQAKQSLLQAQNDYQIIKKGSLSNRGSVNTNIVAQISGTILEIPVREGDQVIESNTFNSGTTIATIADMRAMIFEGKVDETEVGKLVEGSDIKVVLGALDEKEFPAKLSFIAPKGKTENGVVQFTIKADVEVGTYENIKAGYSANAEMEMQSKDSLFCIKEALLQFDRRTNKPFVEVQTGDNIYEKRNVKTGLSDGINIEILEGVTKEDKIKVWNKTSKEDGEAQDRSKN
ncbi:efflux RND transporter periplasmic adaptor subunit [Snuella lapsa]|uniref:Efflux RND transporter periplasmic adaptor subunit n=1 Tax=Snuella lapsa TaxID=870481 RepID=A0ABP6WZM7_9FLAO